MVREERSSPAGRCPPLRNACHFSQEMGKGITFSQPAGTSREGRTVCPKLSRTERQQNDRRNAPRLPPPQQRMRSERSGATWSAATGRVAELRGQPCGCGPRLTVHVAVAKSGLSGRRVSDKYVVVIRAADRFHTNVGQAFWMEPLGPTMTSVSSGTTRLQSSRSRRHRNDGKRGRHRRWLLWRQRRRAAGWSCGALEQSLDDVLRENDARAAAARLNEWQGAVLDASAQSADG